MAVPGVTGVRQDVSKEIEALVKRVKDSPIYLCMWVLALVNMSM